MPRFLKDYGKEVQYEEVLEAALAVGVSLLAS
jgi:hypothetical protein